jgi:energy-coupling factor transport system ATP-binding protein
VTVRRTHAPPTRRGPLRAGELAEAVVLSDLTLITAIVSQLLPAPIGPALLVIAVVPIAVLGARTRVRAVLTGTVAAAGVGFLVLGLPVVQTVVGCAAIGGVVGFAVRRGYGIWRTIGLALTTIWPVVALLADLFLFVFSRNRELVLDQIRNTGSGVGRVLTNANLTGMADGLDDLVDLFVRYWWLTVPLVLFVMILLATMFAYRIAAPSLRRVQAAFASDSLALDTDPPQDDGAPAPVPARLRGVTYRYPGADDDALRDVTLAVESREMVALVGPNGSGKSTLARLLAGRAPTAGSVSRPGAVGLGAPGGTAVVFQRPEMQVLGVRVRDDVTWGLPASVPVDVEGQLERVGLAGFADRETSTLSGGELQRLAVAAALARRPRLLISDESTAMVDEQGRAQLLALLRSLPGREGIAVVHVTHHRAESAVADRVVALDRGRRVERPPAAPSPSVPHFAGPERNAAPLLLLRGVGHEYGHGTPWAHRALAGVDLRIDRGESVLVVGHNGSGKSTLAWILGGLLVPSEGDARIEGEPLWRAVGRVGVAFQHARLQLLRPTVSAEVTAASGASPAAAWQALTEVGFDAPAIALRRVDELSGGQARRVVLASAIAARPRALVLDEPFAGLDDNGRAELTGALVRLRTDHNLTLVCVSHDDDLPAGLVDREIELTEGRVSYDGPGRASDRDAARGSTP